MKPKLVKTSFDVIRIERNDHLVVSVSERDFWRNIGVVFENVRILPLFSIFMKPYSFRFLILLFTLCLFSIGGCGKKEPTVLMLYCSTIHMPVAIELATTYRKAYGIYVQCLPIDKYQRLSLDPPVLSQEEIEKLKKEKILDEIPPAPNPVQEERLQKWVENSISRDFAQFLMDNLHGDIYLCDSADDKERLTENGIAIQGNVVAYLLPVMIVPPGNPNTLYSIADVLDSGYKLGIVHLETNGIGFETDRLMKLVDPQVLEKHNDSENLVVFDSQLEMLHAFENEEIDAAICWKQAADRFGASAMIIRFDRSDYAATEFTALTLSTDSHFNESELFGKFLKSEIGQKILEKHGYTVR